MKHRIAIVGTHEAVSGFSLLGIDVVPVVDAKEATTALFDLKKTMSRDEQGIERNTYAIVFISENLMTDLSPDDEKRLSRGALPAIIPLPSHMGSTGYGQDRLRRIVERAIGSDILQ